MRETDYFLTKVMQNEGKFVRVTRDPSLPNKVARKRRRRIFNEIVTALKLMNFKYEVSTDKHYAIKVFSQEQIKELEDLLQRQTIKQFGGWMNFHNFPASDYHIDKAKLTGTKIDMAILDDIIDELDIKPDPELWTAINQQLSLSSTKGSSEPT